MKIIKTASGKKQIKMSKKEWQDIGKKAGWTNKKTASNWWTVVQEVMNKLPYSKSMDIFQYIGNAPNEQAKIKNFTRFINQHLKKICKANGLPEQVSTYWARHSFATNAVRNGATMEFIQESLGHGNLGTTQNYFAGFDNETKKEFANTIMDFD